MDPEAAWQELLALAASTTEIIDERCDEHGALEEDDRNEIVNDADRMAELVIALDGWIKKGGFPPPSWNMERKKKK